MRGFIRALSRIEENDAAVRRLEAEVAALKSIPAKSISAAKTVELDRGINKVSFFIAIAFGLLLAEGFGAVHQLGLRILTDFLSYIFGIVAAVVGSLAAYKPTRVVYYFWISSILISIGFFFYLLSKGVAPLMPVAVTIGLIASLSALIVYHEILTWKTSRNVANKANSILAVVGGTVIVILMCCILWGSLEP